MKRLILLGVLIFGLVPMAFGATNLYRMRVGDVITPMAQELIDRTNRLCDDYAKLQGHAAAIVRQRDDTDNYTTPQVQYGVVDSAGAPCEPCTEAMFLELNSMVGNTEAALLQWCASVKQ